MWSTIQHITTGIGLVAFLAALGLAAYRATMRNRLNILKTVPPRQRASIVTQQLNTYGVKAENLSPTQQYQLAQQQLNLRARNSLLLTIFAIIVAIICGVIAIFGTNLLATVYSPQTGISRDVIQEYGERPDALYVWVNSHLLLTYQDKFKMMFIAIVPYGDIDIMTDTAIEKSALYTITGSETVLAISSISGLRVIPPSGTSSETFKLNTIFSVVVIPNNVPSEQIRSLSDVTRAGGKIIETRGRDVEFRRLAPARQ